MQISTVAELPPPPAGRTGWPWTEASAPFPATQSSGKAWPKIGIVTPSFNQADYLELAIRSVLLQGYPDLEYVIIDGGSSDESVAVIRKYERWLTYWVSERDRGCSEACAKGLARTAAELLGVMNADDYFAKDAFAKLLALRSEQPENVFWGGANIEFDVAGQNPKLKQPYVHDQKAIGNWGVDARFCAVACLFDGAAYRAVGGFDPRFHTSNDVELWIRLGKAGTFTFTPETVAFVHCNPQAVSGRDKLGNEVALIAANYLQGNLEIARSRMMLHVKKWLLGLKENEYPEAESPTNLLALAPLGVLLRALVLRAGKIFVRGLRRRFRQSK